uniref:Uncharacterized protein n=1 Tax=Glossina palpalis gambiensis TaxID=67801 RepID=A0A1B0B3T3_9MUSC
MLYLLQRGKVRSQVINVPEGLPEILTDITREVLRCQPTPEFAKNIIDRALIKVDEIIGDLCYCDIPKEKSEQMSLAMEDCFKRFLAKRRCEKDRQSEVLKFKELDILDELIRKCKFNDDELKKSRQAIEEAYNKFMDFYLLTNTDDDATEALYQHFRARELQRQVEKQEKEAATKIQPPSFDIHTPDDQTTMKHDLAARKIQSFFRNRFSKTYERKTKPDDMCADLSKISMMDPLPITSSLIVEAQSANEERPASQTEPVAVPEERKELQVSDANKKDIFEEQKSAQIQEKPIITQAEDVDPTETLYQYLEERELQRLSERKSSEAATKIQVQAFFRGYMVRKTLRELRQTTMWWQTNPEVPCSDERIKSLYGMEKPKIQQTNYVDDECKYSSNVSMAARSPQQFKTRVSQKQRQQSVSTWTYPDSIVEQEGFVKRIYKAPSETMMDTFGKSEDQEDFESDDMYNAAIEDDFQFVT